MKILAHLHRMMTMMRLRVNLQEARAATQITPHQVISLKLKTRGMVSHQPSYQVGIIQAAAHSPTLHSMLNSLLRVIDI